MPERNREQGDISNIDKQKRDFKQYLSSPLLRIRERFIDSRIHPSFLVAGLALSLIGGGFIVAANNLADRGDVYLASRAVQTGVTLLFTGVATTVHRLITES